jgi:hypothetical protein
MPWLDGIPHFELHPGGTDHRRQASPLCKDLCAERINVNHLTYGSLA